MNYQNEKFPDRCAVEWFEKEVCQLTSGHKETCRMELL